MGFGVSIAASPDDGGTFVGGASPAQGWRLSPTTAGRWAIIVALLMSTQYLFQPFVWAHWPVDEVLLGWVAVAWDRVLVALSIAAALVTATRSRAQRATMRAGLIGAALLAGATAGEVVLLATGSANARDDLSGMAGNIIKWSGLAWCIAGMYYLWLRDNRAREAARADAFRRSTTEAMLVRTQLQSLRQQIDPHFLFNTLATIRRLKETEPADGARLLRLLIDYLRSAARVPTQRTTLGEELDLVKSHLAVVAMRMNGRLAIEFDVPGELRPHPCPPLTLATLVENAIKHGITPSAEGGRIAVRARHVGETLELCVEDTGVGISNTGPSAGGAGIGLINTRARLHALHGGAATLVIERNVPHGVRAVIRVPFDPGVEP